MLEIEEKDNNLVHLLWTGGWDSTFRLLQLTLEQKRIVQPVYIMDTARISTIVEIKAMDRIKNSLAHLFPYTLDLILPTFFFSIHDIPTNSELNDKFQKLNKISYLGGQYNWLSSFAIARGINDLELSIHVDDKAYPFIKGHIIEDDGMNKRRFLLDPRISIDDPVSLFSPFRFPLLEWTKVQMKDHAERIGTSSVMDLTWFCHKPISGKPCGFCNPCIYSIEEGMKFRFSKIALFRYKASPFFIFSRKAFSKMRSIAEKF